MRMHSAGAVAAALATAAGLATAPRPAIAADVGVSVSVGQPGFYGRIDIGSYPRPAVIYAEPVVVHRAPGGVAYPPAYLHVPPGHAKNWAKHCGKYNACAHPVYFVEEGWYNEVVVARQGARVARHDDDRGPGRGNGHGRGRNRD